MDPTACLKRILDAFDESDYQEAQYACEDLGVWLAGNGFPPTASTTDWLTITALLQECAIRMKRRDMKGTR